MFVLDAAGGGGGMKASDAMSPNKPVECALKPVGVCIGYDTCEYYGTDPMKGFVWINKEKSTQCALPEYGVHYAGLHIQPVTAHVWKITVVMREGGYKLNDIDIPVAPEAISFDFGTFSLSFPDDLNAQLKWTDSGSASNHSMRFAGRFNIWAYAKGWLTMVRYTFNMESDGERFLDVIGPVVRYVVNGTAGSVVEMNESTFVEQLHNISVCDLKMLKNSQVCHGSCDDFASNSTAPNALPVCKSILWFNDKSGDGLTRKWKRVEGSLDCKAGEWSLNWTSWEKGSDPKGYTMIDGNSELQCSSIIPEKLTGMGKAVIGVGAGVGLLGAVALIFICGRRRRNNRKNKNGARTPDSSSKNAVWSATEREDKAGTPRGATTRSTEREGTQRAAATPESPPPPYQLKDPKPMRRWKPLATILVFLLCINGLPVNGDKTTTKTPESEDSGAGLAIGLGIGGTMLVILLLIAGYCWWKRKQLHETTSYKRSPSFPGFTSGPRTTHTELSEYIANTLRSSSEKARTPNTPNKKKKSKNPLKKMLHIKDDDTNIEGLHTEHISKENTSNRVVASAEVPGNAAAAEGAAAAAATAKPRGAFRSTPPQSPFKLQEPKGATAAAGPPLPTKFQSVALA
ncbi:hypothetical protein PRIPAC_91997 [Pristionchus pacificus]|uniref:Uncharacterized protein n=1 Tax=Pristionchus pacificus TaxID=54126 RepID=A0A2A6BPA2_PRIPA|nr:hypothetical protein PRIPAC_91997 [Pristionchus pacificus]|eukprot:PDM67740.1 hypothetical protein PRIPAC_45784 [Pristionchus pacificus]